MTSIRDLFSREIARDIKEVIKVDDRQSVMQEIEEYIPTDHIAGELIEALEKFQDTINNPSDEINLWVSGFFGSGKSSFAKILGYLLANPEIDGTAVADRFFQLHEIPKAKALLNTIHASAPTETVLLDLNTSPNVLQEGEPIVLPVYRTLLHEFDYSHDIVLAELEFEREAVPGRLEQFAAKYEAIFGEPWAAQRGNILAKNRASRVLHELEPETFPSADSWSNAAQPPTITAKWFATRALELLKRRRPGKQRLVLVVDEVGQYVSRSTDRMRHLQGLAEECQKTRGRLWLVATSQEKLTDVVDSLAGKQTELAKAQDRFPIRPDLLPSDIDEVTGKRVLDKTAAGAAELRALLDADRNKLTTSVTLQSDRHNPFTDDDFVRLYPLVPYQLPVLIDAVSARRAQGGTPQTMGGSNRTLIRHAQQLLSNRAVGMADLPTGSLVTLDRSYVLLEDVIPTAWRGEVDQVAAKHGNDSVEAKIMRVLALCADVPGLKLNSRNLAVVLHPAMSSDPLEPAVVEALGHLQAEDRVRETEDGFRLQSPEQKDWEKTRRGIDMKPGDAVRLRRTILKDALGSLLITKGRAFKVELHAEREKQSDGDITLDIRDEADVDGLRQASRAEHAKQHIFWAYSTADDTWDTLTELHRSTEMIERYDNAGQSDAQRVLLAEERRRRDNLRQKADQLLARDLAKGKTIFDGTLDDAPELALKAAAAKVVTGLVDKIYPQLATFAGSFKRADVLQILQADTLDGLPDSVGPDGLRLFRVTKTGRELVTDSGPIDAVVAWIKARKQFGEDQNGAQLERHFGGPPYGASVESLQVVLAGAVRGGLLQVVSQAAKITSATDQRLEQIFGNLPKFRAASFQPAEDSGPSLAVRGEVSEWLATVTGEHLGLDAHELAEAGRRVFEPLRQPCIEARSRLSGAGLTVPEGLNTMYELLGRVSGTDDELVITTLHERRADLDAGRADVTTVATLIEEQFEVLKAAQAAVRAASSLSVDQRDDWTNELTEMLQRARYGEDLARIKTVTTTIEDATAKEREACSAQIVSQVEAAIQTLRTRYPAIDAAAFDTAVAPLNTLTTPTDLATLRANAQSVAGVAQSVAAALDVLSTTKEVRHVTVTDVWGGPITSAEDLETALSRLREAVFAQLDDDTEVRFQLSATLSGEQRTLLEKLVQNSRAGLEDDLASTLAGRYGIDRDGRIEAETQLTLSNAEAVVRADLVEIIDHLRSDGENQADSVERLVREAAFTHLNRLVAVRVAEAIGLLPETIAQGTASSGFRDFSEIAPTIATTEWGRFAAFVRLCADELAADVPALFDPRNPLLELEPTEAALELVVQAIASLDTAIWAAPDALGWAYQFFNTAEEREAIKKAGAPKTARELAVVNQFFTPSYVVDFLVHNGLGAHLSAGFPGLADELLMLIEPPPERREIDLANVSVLDPACGSGHFLLGAYDVLERAWRHAGVDPASAAPAIVSSLWGIDIDPRVTQIAQAAVIFRARRHCRDGKLPLPNIACARALPAGARVDQLVDALPKHIGRAVRAIADELVDAPTLGPLLKVEQRLSREARDIFGTGVIEGTLAESAGGEAAEGAILDAVSAIADATTSSAAQRLFAAEAGDTVRFVEAMTRRYSAVLMNPPFGDPASSTKAYLKAAYSEWIPSTCDLFALFVGRGLELAEPGGTVGAITSRVGLFLTSFEKWRSMVLLGNDLGPLVDLGERVMEQATVEAAAYVIRAERRQITARPTFIRALTMSDRASGLASVAQGIRSGSADDAVVFRPQLDALRALDGRPVAYWINSDDIETLSRNDPFEPSFGTVRVGLQTGDDFRFVRAWWEVDPARTTRSSDAAGGRDSRSQLNAGARWAPIIKAGASQPWFSPNLLVVDWERDGERLRGFVDAEGKLRSRPQNTEVYFKAGFSWTRRAPRLVPYVVPSGCIPSVSRYQAFPTVDPYEAISLAASNVTSAYLRFYGEKFLWPNFLVDNVKNLPTPRLDDETRKRVASFVEEKVAQRRVAFRELEPFREFVSPREAPPDLSWDPFSLLGEDLESAVARAYGLTDESYRRLTRDLTEALVALGNSPPADEADEAEAVGAAGSWLDRLVSYLVGVAFGRWDARIGANPSLAPDAPGAFDPPSRHPLGMLLDEEGEPARHTPVDYPLEIPKGGCLLQQPGHQWDIESRVLQAAAAFLGNEAGLAEALSVHMKRPSLTRYLAGGFFKSHLAVYTRGRRKAPIYWQLQVPSKTWGVWLYYPRLSREMLFAVMKETEQRQRLAQQQIAHLQREADTGGGGRKASELVAELDTERRLAVELEAFRAEADRIANLGWEPDLDDGAVLNAAAVADLFPAWKDAAAYRKDLRAGKHSWATVARFADRL